tara:strand:- start:349 stop:1038 length:690 start_codon:yes stop_codon:yes gene_type:complete
MMDQFGKTLVPRGVANLKLTGVPGVVEPDPVIRDAQTFMEDIKAQIPGLSATLKPSLDRWGRDKVRGVVGADGERNLALGPDRLSPIYMRREKKNIVDEEMIRLGGIYLRNDSAEYSPEGLREPITLTDDARYFRNQQRGKIAFKLLEDLIQGEEYKQLKKYSEAAQESGKPNEKLDETLKQRIRGVYIDALEMADQKLIRHPIYGEPLTNLIEAMARDQAKADGIGAR